MDNGIKLSLGDHFVLSNSIAADFNKLPIDLHTRKEYTKLCKKYYDKIKYGQEVIDVECD